MSTKRVYLSAPHMGGGEEGYVREAFASNWISTLGPNVDAFEAAFSARHGGLPCLALSSGTAALHLALRLFGVGVGDTVFCPTLTFVASANCPRYLGAEPVFIDSDTASWNMDPALLETALDSAAKAGKLPKAVIAVHLYGQSADMDPILAACARHDVPVIEDAAEALGTTYKGRPAGTLAPLSIYSFNGNKIITTSGGGMLLGHNRAHVEKARFWSQQARDPGIAYEHTELGYNYRMSNILAGVGRGQLEVLDERVRQRRAIAERYASAFADLGGLVRMPQAPYGLHTNWLSVFLVDEAQLGCTRDSLIEALAAENIESRPVWKPMHMQPLYAKCQTWGGGVAERLFTFGICLPSSSNLGDEDQTRVIDLVRRRVQAARHA